jgi:hypothetical protein
VPVDPLETGLSHVVRRQLYELRIDPDGPSQPVGPSWAHRITGWRHAHKRALLAGAAIGMVVALLVSGFAIAAQTQQHTTQTPWPTSIGISLGDVTVQTAAPSYQRFSMGQGVVVVHLRLHNPNATPAVLSASDLVLVDDRGAVFPISWYDADGKPHDGLATPAHTLLGLDPGADASIDVPFLIMGRGPFTVRHEQHADTVRAAPVTITLDPPQPPRTQSPA